ncbi:MULTISPECIES: helix-turn-helix domain-containing protein [unclassified Chryseobacterium]|uniref:helix-turn-helix domain-containing protein n=1 Tax=unclassified Chryseobacterium TaxID=2593645 RepID=UPI00100B2FA8|nr:MULTISPECIES: helix-turn-helix transcriptional regulator [unclassified Chryseobacterium]RXM53327.1 transcriptional regulator [Chryseobacterium sp. CH25]RXM65472.1 transcriptional regulator [Chryseobacterium sp. CH1]
MEKLKSIRKQRGYTQQQIADILATDVSNYSRKENGEVKIYDEEWEKIAKALDVSVDDIKEERNAQNNQNTTLNDSASFNDNASINYNQYCNIPNYLLENQQEYINLLKEQIEILKAENAKFKKK